MLNKQEKKEQEIKKQFYQTIRRTKVFDSQTLYYLAQKIDMVQERHWQLIEKSLWYIATLLETAKQKKKRKPSEWSLFAGKYLKQGKTMKEAATDWKENKKSK